MLGFALALQGFLDTNMLISPTQNSRVGGIAQGEPLTQGFFALQWSIGFTPSMQAAP